MADSNDYINSNNNDNNNNNNNNNNNTIKMSIASPSSYPLPQSHCYLDHF